MSPSPEGQNRTDRMLGRIKDNPLIALVVVIGVVVIGLASFTGAIRELGSLFQRGGSGTTADPHEREPRSTGSISPSPKPAVLSFSAEPARIDAGAETSLSWRVEDADAVSIDGGIGPVALSGSTIISPTETSDYTLTAEGPGGSTTSSIVVTVSSGLSFDGPLVLRDIFPSDAGWTQPQSDVYRWEIGQGRFLMELTENRSAIPATRSVAIAVEDEFLLQVLAKSLRPTDFSYGLCWFVTGGESGYFLYLSPGESSGGTYQLLRSETWNQPGPSGSIMRYGQTVNMLDPSNVNRTFRSPAILSGAAENALAVVRSGDSVKIYINGSYASQASVPAASIERVGVFIAGLTAVEFRDFTLRVR